MRGKAAAVVISLTAMAASHAAQAAGFDALGAPLAARTLLLSNPAAASRPGYALGAGVADLYVGANLRRHQVRMQWVGQQIGMGTGLEMLRSPVHRTWQAALALQLRRRFGRLGASVSLQSWNFTNGVSRSRWHLHLAAGLALGASADMTLHVHPPIHVDEQPRLALQISTSHFAPFHLLVNEQRTAGFPAHRRYGVAWKARDLWLRLGYDQQTQATSVGLTLGTGPWAWDATAQSHPDLGWSSAWWLDFAR